MELEWNKGREKSGKIRKDFNGERVLKGVGVERQGNPDFGKGIWFIAGRFGPGIFGLQKTIDHIIVFNEY